MPKHKRNTVLKTDSKLFFHIRRSLIVFDPAIRISPGLLTKNSKTESSQTTNKQQEMSKELIWGAVGFVWAIGCFLFWKKERHMDWLWFTWIGAVAGTANFVDLFLKNIVQATPDVLSLSNLIIRVLDVGGIASAALRYAAVRTTLDRSSLIEARRAVACR